MNVANQLGSLFLEIIHDKNYFNAFKLLKK
jgi:hypothetical protein